MPSFLSKVFGRKKQDDKELSPGSRTSAASLLEGKFEAVSPTVSESAEKHLAQPEKGSGGNGGFLQRIKPTTTVAPEPARGYEPPPHLTLSLAFGTGKVERPLGSVFAYPDGQITLDDKAIGERRLTPSETLVLVKACSQAIVARGLETPGVMHPHWYSADPLVQRRLISLFIRSLAPTASSTLPQFDSEIVSTRSPHDVAAVLRWGMRHLQFDPLDQSWYQTFFAAEQSAGYPPNAFSQHLVPLLPSTHVELLTAAIDLFSSLAAHAEANSISGSKVSKFLGLWLLEAKRAEETDTWPVFYDRWEQAGRKMEHLFLSNIRQETLAHPMPKRLTELVKNYPYGQNPTDGLLPRPRFSTRQYTALYVRLDTELSSSRPTHHPLRLISAALLADDASESSLASLWAKIKSAAQGSADDALSSPASRVFSDETLRFLSLGLSEVASATTPSLTLVLPEKSAPISRQETETSLAPSVPPPSNGSSNSIGIDWTQFSNSGFLETTPLGSHLAKTLMDSDIEKTTPQLPRKPSKKSKSAPSRKSVDTLPPIIVPSSSTSALSPPPEEKKSKITDLTQIEVDEAFIDFWNDALVDPVAKGWPAFVVGKLKLSLEQESVLEGGKKVEWVVIEQTFSRPPPPPATATSESATTVASSTTERRARPTSPRPSLKSMTNSSKKRFSFWTGSRRGSTSNVRASEMGESVDEGREAAESMDVPASPVKKESKKDKRKSVPPPVLEEAEETKEDSGKTVVAASAAIAGVTAAAGAAAVVAATSAEGEDKPVPAKPEVITPAPEERSAPVEEPVKEADVPVVAATVPAEATPEMTPVVEEPVPASKETTAEPVVESAVPEPVVESVMPEPTVEIVIPEPAVEELPALEPVVEAPVIEEQSVPVTVDDVPTPAPVDDIPAPAPIVDDPAPAVVDEPAVEESAPVAVVETLSEEVEPAIVEEIVDAPVVLATEPTAPSVAEESEVIPAIPAEMETPIVEEAPVVEESPVVDEAPVVEEALVVEEAPVVDETPVVEQAHVAPSVDEPSILAEEPIEEVVAPVATVEDIVAPVAEQVVEPAEAPEEPIQVAATVVPAAEEEAPVAAPAVEPSVVDEAAVAPEEAEVEEPAVEEPIPADETAALPEDTVPDVEEVVPAPVDDAAPEAVPVEEAAAETSADVEDAAPVDDVPPSVELASEVPIVAQESVADEEVPFVAEKEVEHAAEAEAVPEVPLVSEQTLPQDEVVEAQAEPIVEETTPEEPQAELLEDTPVTADKRADSPEIEDGADEASAVPEDNSPAPIQEEVFAVPTEVEAPPVEEAELPEPIAPADSADISEEPIEEVAADEPFASEPVDAVADVVAEVPPVHEDPVEDVSAPISEESAVEVLDPVEEHPLSPATVEEAEEEVSAPVAEVVESPSEEQVAPPTDDVIEAAPPVEEPAATPATVDEVEEVAPAPAVLDEVEEVAPTEEEAPALDHVPTSVEEPTHVEDEKVADTSAPVEDVAVISGDAPEPIVDAYEDAAPLEEPVQTPVPIEETVEPSPEPEADAAVTLSPVPVVETDSELPLVEKEDEKEDTEDLSLADTPGPQIALDAAADEEPKIPPGLAETSANGNGKDVSHDDD